MINGDGRERGDGDARAARAARAASADDDEAGLDRATAEALALLAEERRGAPGPPRRYRVRPAGRFDFDFAADPFGAVSSPTPPSPSYRWGDPHPEPGAAPQGPLDGNGAAPQDPLDETGAAPQDARAGTGAAAQESLDGIGAAPQGSRAGTGTAARTPLSGAGAAVGGGDAGIVGADGADERVGASRERCGADAAALGQADAAAAVPDGPASGTGPGSASGMGSGSASGTGAAASGRVGAVSPASGRDGVGSAVSGPDGAGSVASGCDGAVPPASEPDGTRWFASEPDGALPTAPDPAGAGSAASEPDGAVPTGPESNGAVPPASGPAPAASAASGRDGTGPTAPDPADDLSPAPDPADAGSTAPGRSRPSSSRPSHASPGRLRASSVIPWALARDVAGGAVGALGVREVAVGEALGQTLADGLTALVDLPSFDTSAMDGWAVAGPGPWRVGGDEGILAGRGSVAPLADGHAVRIATGARVPPGATAVLRSEHGVVGPHGELQAQRRVTHGQDVRPRGQECQKGDELLPAGTFVSPAVLGLAAACGYDRVRVVPRPRVEVLVLGDELLREGLPHDGRIRDALGPMLGPWLEALGAEVVATRRLGDEASALGGALEASDADLVLTTGGTAAGPVDHVHPTLRRLGAELLVDGVAVRPGHPMLLARLGDGRHLVGLPGNPLAAVAGLFTLAAPLLRALAGRPAAQRSWAQVAEVVPGHASSTRLVPVVRRPDGWLLPLRFHGPAMLRGLAGADALAVVPPGGLAAGDAAEVLVLPCPGGAP